MLRFRQLFTVHCSLTTITEVVVKNPFRYLILVLVLAFGAQGALAAATGAITGKISDPALAGVAGLRVQRQGGPGSLTALKFRGLPSFDTSVLVDDMRVRDASDLNGSLAPFFEDLTLTNLDRIEIVRGAGSTLYGTNAVG